MRISDYVLQNLTLFKLMWLLLSNQQCTNYLYHDFSHKAYGFLKPLDELHKKHVLMKRIVMISWKNVAVVALVSLGVTTYCLEQKICKTS